MARSHIEIQQGRATRHLGNPLDFLADDNMREREICDLIDQLADCETPPRDNLETVLTYLKQELPLHLQDENEDLLPLLRQRCLAEDQIGKVINRLQSNHGHALTDLPRVVGLLRKSTSFTPKTRETLRNFASHARRHITVETAILLPIARVRLKASDLDQMRWHMLERRGLTHMMG